MAAICVIIVTFSVSLEGISRLGHISQHKFTGFFITVEKDQNEERQQGTGEDSVGRFHIAPESSSMSKFSEKCQNLVTHTSSFSKTEILVKRDLMNQKAKVTLKYFKGLLDGAATRKRMCSIQVYCNRTSRCVVQ